VVDVAAPSIPNAYGQNQQKVRRSLAPTAPVQQIRPLSERLKDPLLQKTIDEGGIPERAPLPTPPSPDAIIKPRPREFVNPFEGEEPPKAMTPGRVNVAARPDQNFATSFSPRPFAGPAAAPPSLPTPPAGPARLSERFAAPTAGPSAVAPPESPTSIPPAGLGLNTTQVAPPRGPGYVNMATVGNVDRAPGAEPSVGGRIPMPGTPANPVNLLTPEAQAMTSRMKLDPAGMGGAFANFANALAERQGQPKLSDRFRLPTNQEATLAGGTPNVTASPNFGAPRPTPGGDPVVQRFKQPEAPPQFVNADGKAMLNDPATLDDRVAAAKQRLSERLAARATPPAPVAEPSAPPAPPVPPSAVLPAAPPLAAAGPEGSKRPSVLDRLNGTEGTVPVSAPAQASPILQSTPEIQQQPLFSGGRSTPLTSRFAPPTPAAPPVLDPNKPYDPNNTAPANPNKPTETTPVSLPAPAPAAPEFTRFTPPASGGIPAANVTGPVTSPEQVAANKARRAEVLNKRQEKVEARGAARAEARTQRLESRKRGPSLVDQLAARNPAFAAEVVRQQGAQALADKELGFRKGENAADRAQRGELAGKDFELKDRTLSETERANQSREGLSRDQLTSGDRRLSEELRSREKVAGINAAATQGASKGTEYWLADAATHFDRAKKLREQGLTAEADRADAMGNESRQRAMGGAAPATAPVQAQPAGPLTTRLMPGQAKKQIEASGSGIDYDAIKGLGASYGGLSPRELAGPGSTFRGGMASAMSGLQMIAGGAGAEMDRRAAMLANRLKAMEDRNPTSFALSIPAIQTALQESVHPDFQAFVANELPRMKGGAPIAAYLTAVFNGQRPNLSETDARAIRTLNEFGYINAQ
jgi:hypothetical protein